MAYGGTTSPTTTTTITTTEAVETCTNMQCKLRFEEV